MSRVTAKAVTSCYEVNNCTNESEKPQHNAVISARVIICGVFAAVYHRSSSISPLKQYITAQAYVGLGTTHRLHTMKHLAFPCCPSNDDSLHATQCFLL